MADQPFIGEIRMFGGNFAPVGWALCEGQIQQISQNSALFNLIGTTYGGDGVNTFALPDLRGRVPNHQGQSAGTSVYVIGEISGVENVTLTGLQLPAHTHTANAAAIGNTDTPVNHYPAADPAGNVVQFKANTAANATMNGSAIATAGGNQPHSNLQPLLAVNYIIALFGIFPSRN
jgi:microcystin-dependent protein